MCRSLRSTTSITAGGYASGFTRSKLLGVPRWMLYNKAPESTKATRILQPDSYKQRICDMWEGRGPDYDKFDTFHRSLAKQLVARAGLQAGHTVLDLASGTGMVALPAAELVGAGRVVAVDISTSMLAEAKRKAAASSNPGNLEFVTSDIEAVDFSEATFDRVLCSSGMLYLQDMSAAIGRFRHWLKPGGEIHFNTPKEPCVPATTTFYRLVNDRFGIQLADAAAPLGSAELVQQVLNEAGFLSSQVDMTHERILYQGCDAMDYAQKTWRSLTSNAIMTPLDDLVSSEQLHELHSTYLDVVRAMADPWQSKEGVQNPYIMLWCSATKAQV